ncbi:MAG: hypothetical protein HYW48_04400 [Deltaproteobacteria bacterium]|nr:hypothetical protein [Deltaproteobacteria bacterium]
MEKEKKGEAESKTGAEGKIGENVTFSSIEEIEKTCNQSADKYFNELPKEEKEKLALPEDKAKQMLANICKETLKKKYLEDEKDIDEARKIPIPPQGVLGIAEASVDEVPTDVGGDVFASALKQGFIPFFETVMKMDKKSAEAAADSAARAFGFLTKGLGIGFAVSASAGYYVSGSLALTAEFVYHRPPKSAGELGFYCAPGLSLGIGTGASVGTTRSIIKTIGCSNTPDYEGGFLTIYIPVPKMDLAFSIGVDPAKFVDFVNYLFKVNWGDVTTPDKVNAELDAIDKLIVQKVKDSPNVYEIITIFTFLLFIDAALSASNFVKRDAAAVSQTGGRTVTKAQTMAALLYSKILSLEVFKDALTWPAFRDVMQNFHDKTLQPAETFPFTRTLITKFIESGAGFCNSISLADNLTTLSTDVLTIKSGIGYSYYVNPKFSGFDGKRAKPEDKIILYLDSLVDLANPEKWEKMARTFDSKTIKPVDKALVEPAREAYNKEVAPVVDAAGKGVARKYEETGAKDVVDKDLAPAVGSAGEYFHEGEFGDDVENTYEAGKTAARATFGLADGTVGDFVADKTGFKEIGPLNFIAKMTNMVNPIYLFEECLKPTGEHMAEIGKSVYRLFAEPPPSQ